MQQSDRQRWDKRYRNGAYAERTWPSAYLEQSMLKILPAASGARALDLACGRGRNSLFLAHQGFVVDAVDVSAAAIAQGAYQALQSRQPIYWCCQDVQRHNAAESWRPQHKYDLIIMFRFVATALLPVLVEHLQPGGHLLVEEHLQWSDTDAVVGPSNPAFRVTSTELKQALASCSEHLQVIDEYTGIVDEPDGSQAALSRICVRR